MRRVRPVTSVTPVPLELKVNPDDAVRKDLEVLAVCPDPPDPAAPTVSLETVARRVTLVKTVDPDLRENADLLDPPDLVVSQDPRDPLDNLVRTDSLDTPVNVVSPDSKARLVPPDLVESSDPKGLKEKLDLLANAVIQVPKDPLVILVYPDKPARSVPREIAVPQEALAR